MTRIVIDMPDKDRRDIYWVKGKRVANLIGEYKVIAVLPEEHGDLIDRSKLDTRERGNNSQRCMWRNIKQIIENAPIVVEADKENKE